MTSVPSAAANPRRISPRRRIAIAAAALITALGSYVVVATTAASAADSLLSVGKTAVASSEENIASVAANVVDGNAGTRWSSQFSDPQWIRVDLGATYTISQVVLNWETAYATAFQLQTSADATNWTTVYSTTTGTGGVQTLTVSGSGRYVRMYGTARATQYGYSLWAFDIYGSGAPAACNTSTNAALNHPSTASSTENVGTPASAAFDGNAGTRWSSAYSDPQWISVDLGSSQSICRVVLTWETAYATAFQLQTSTNNTTWTSISSTTTGTGGTQTLTVGGTGRYVRLYATARATQYGDSLWEFAVNVGGTPPTTTPPTSTPPTGDVLLSYNKPATASTYQDDANCPVCTPAKAFDSDPTTRWATSDVNGWVDPGWIYVDLGASATIHKVILQWDPAYATAYQVQTSTDTTNWTSIYSTTTGKGFKETLTVNGTGRYVRMYGTARSNGYGYSLWEFQIYGTGGNPTTPPALPPNVNFPASRLVFDDEFNDAVGAKPNASRWFADTGNGQNGEQEYYTDNLNAQTDGTGNLVLQARRETSGQLTSARINTSKSFTFTYGHAEARIKVSGTQGLWPAFWLLGANFPTVGWPSCGEIDIMEHVGKVPNAVYSTLHAPAYNGGGGFGSPYTITGDFASDFHTYAVDWNQTHMTFSVDGNAFFTADRGTVETTKGPWVYDHPFYIILNNAIGGDWPGPIDSTTVLPQNMLVDYVRVYQN